MCCNTARLPNASRFINYTRSSLWICFVCNIRIELVGVPGTVVEYLGQHLKWKMFNNTIDTRAAFYTNLEYEHSFVEKNTMNSMSLEEYNTVMSSARYRFLCECTLKSVGWCSVLGACKKNGRVQIIIQPHPSPFNKSNKWVVIVDRAKIYIWLMGSIVSHPPTVKTTVLSFGTASGQTQTILVRSPNISYV